MQKTNLTFENSINPELLLNTFLELVRLDSPSGQEGPVRDYLLARFQQLNLSPTVDVHGNVLLTLPANRSQSQLSLIVTGHMDVVPPCLGVKPIVEGEGDERVIRSDGTTVLGADDKAALAAILEALTVSLAEDLPRPELLFLITVDEEVSLNGAKLLDPASYQHADFAIAFDHTGEQGTLIYEAPTYIHFKIKVTGKSVHAGMTPELGTNAIHVLSKALSQLEFGRLGPDLTTNIAKINGGKATNVVPDTVFAEGEIRSTDSDKAFQQLEMLQQILAETTAQYPQSGFELTHEVTFHHYRTDPESPMVNRIKQAITQIGLPVLPVSTNGGSDVNVFCKNGVPGIVLSAGYVAPHALTEHAYLKNIVVSARLILSIWEQFAA